MQVELETIREGLYRVPVPIPFPTKYTYCYLIRDDQGWCIIDAGLYYEPAIETWKSVFTELQISPDSVHRIYITHFHPDHLGLSAWLQEYTGAPVYMNPVEIDIARRVWSPDGKQAHAISTMCMEHGMPEELSLQMAEHMKELTKKVQMPQVLLPLTDEVVRLGGEDWQVWISPGHSDGQVGFFQPESGLYLAADHILHKITPNVSIWPHCDPNPLKMYFQSLNKAKAQNIKAALPSHNGIIYDAEQRINEIIQHHEERLNHMQGLAADGKTAYEVAEILFNHRQLSPHQWRFAITETLAHLVYLQEEGRLSMERKNGMVYFFAQS